MIQLTHEHYHQHIQMIQRLIVPQSVEVLSKTSGPLSTSAPYTVEPAERRRRLRRQRHTIEKPSQALVAGLCGATGDEQQQMPSPSGRESPTFWFIGPTIATLINDVDATTAANADGALPGAQRAQFLPHRRKSARIHNGRRRTRSEQNVQQQLISHIPRANPRFKHLLDRIQIESTRRMRQREYCCDLYYTL